MHFSDSGKPTKSSLIILLQIPCVSEADVV
nr:MAG TPA: hypothetical protein [Caudoviricetes sp.]